MKKIGLGFNNNMKNINKKNGVVLTTLITIIILLSIIAGTVTTFSLDYIREQQKQELLSTLEYVESAMEEKILSNSIYDLNIYGTTISGQMKARYNEYAAKHHDVREFDDSIVHISQFNLKEIPNRRKIKMYGVNVTVYSFIVYDLKIKKAYYLGPAYVYYDRENKEPIFRLKEKV